MAGESFYYYDVDGSQVPLERAGELAVDVKAAMKADLRPGVLDGLKQIGRELRGGVIMLDGSEVPHNVEEALDEVGALQPVFGKETNGFIVVLPEVRIDSKDAAQASEVRTYLKSSDIDLDVVRDAGQRMVVRPKSGRGLDALQLANRVEQALHPMMAQPRFLRIVHKP